MFLFSKKYKKVNTNVRELILPNFSLRKMKIVSVLKVKLECLWH
jgi:hypothetical protein